MGRVGRKGRVSRPTRGTRRPRSHTSRRFHERARKIVDATIETDKHPVFYTQRLIGQIGYPHYFTLLRPRAWDHLSQIAKNYGLAADTVPPVNSVNEWCYDLISHRAECQLTNTSNSAQRLQIYKIQARKALSGGDVAQYASTGTSATTAVNMVNLPMTNTGTASTSSGGSGPRPDGSPAQVVANGFSKTNFNGLQIFDANYSPFDSVDFTRFYKILSVTDKIIQPGKTMMIVDGSKKHRCYSNYEFTNTIDTMPGAIIYFARSIGLPIHDSSVTATAASGAAAKVAESKTWWDLTQRYAYGVKFVPALMTLAATYPETVGITGSSQALIDGGVITAPLFTYQGYNLVGITPATS